jgi:hypothetical protein
VRRLSACAAASDGRSPTTAVTRAAVSGALSPWRSRRSAWARARRVRRLGQPAAGRGMRPPVATSRGGRARRCRSDGAARAGRGVRPVQVVQDDHERPALGCVDDGSADRLPGGEAVRQLCGCRARSGAPARPSRTDVHGHSGGAPSSCEQRPTRTSARGRAPPVPAPRTAATCRSPAPRRAPLPAACPAPRGREVQRAARQPTSGPRAARGAPRTGRVRRCSAPGPATPPGAGPRPPAAAARAPGPCRARPPAAAARRAARPAPRPCRPARVSASTRSAQSRSRSGMQPGQPFQLAGRPGSVALGQADQRLQLARRRVQSSRRARSATTPAHRRGPRTAAPRHRPAACSSSARASRTGTAPGGAVRSSHQRREQAARAGHRLLEAGRVERLGGQRRR